MERILAVVLKEFSSHENITIDVHENSVKIITSETSVTINNRTKEVVSGFCRRPGYKSGNYVTPQRANQTTFSKSAQAAPNNLTTGDVPVVMGFTKTESVKQWPKVAVPNDPEARPAKGPKVSQLSQTNGPKNSPHFGYSQNDRPTQQKYIHESLMVEVFDESKHLFLEVEHNFVVKEVSPGKIKVVGKAVGSEIVPLTSDEEITARDMGLVL